MSEANKALIRKLFEATNAKDLATLRALYAAEFSLNGVPTGFEDFAASFPQFFAAFPDATGAVEECIAEGDTVAARWTTTGTHTGEYAGAPATGKRVAWQGTNLYRIEGGRIVEMWQSADVLGLLQQIGAVSYGAVKKPAREHRPVFRFDPRPANNGGGPNTPDTTS